MLFTFQVFTLFRASGCGKRCARLTRGFISLNVYTDVDSLRRLRIRIFPLIFAVRAQFWRFVTIWVIYSFINSYGNYFALSSVCYGCMQWLWYIDHASFWFFSYSKSVEATVGASYTSVSLLDQFDYICHVRLQFFTIEVFFL